MAYCFWAGYLGHPHAERLMQRFSTFYGVHVEANNIPDLFGKRIAIVGATFLLKVLFGTVIGFLGGGIYRLVQLWHIVV